MEGSCWADAECLTDAGDDVEAVVSMVCNKSGQCACRLRQKIPPVQHVEFQFPATCTSDEAVEKLMLEHCMKGMQMAAPSPEEPSVQPRD